MKISTSLSRRNLLRSITSVVVATVFCCAVADAQVVTDGSLGAQVNVPGSPYVISPTLGQQRGANLFHSFTTFNIGTGQSAQFVSNAGTTNIVARITGGTLSQINGTVSANANLFLLNPQGIIFGNGANINVTGSFHASTADYVRFNDGARFYVSLGALSVLTTVAPSAFGFLDNTVGVITASNASFTTSNSQSMSFIGGDISLTNSQLHAPQGRVNLAAVASPGEVIVGSSSLDTSAFATLGNIRLNHAWINANGEDAASIYIRGGQFVMENDSSIVGLMSTGSSTRVIDVAVDSLQLNHSLIDFEPASSSAINGPIANASITTKQFSVSNTAAIFVAGGGDLSVKAESLNVSASALVGTGSALGTSRAGNLLIQANSVSVDNGGLSALSADSGDAGGVSIVADTVSLTGGGGIISTTSGPGTGGQISIKARQLVVDGTQSTTVTTGISAASLGVNSNAGSAGKISIAVDSLALRNGVVSSSTAGPGRGGDVSVISTTTLVERGAAITSETGANSTATNFGAGGAITIKSNSLQILSGGRVSANTFANGVGGTVTVTADQLIVDQTNSAAAVGITGITANTGSIDNRTASGAGGNLFLQVSDLQLRNQGLISTNAFGTGVAGRIDIGGGAITVSNGAAISASSFGQIANAGSANDIVIQATKLDVNNFGQVINSTTGPGAAGRLLIATNSLNVASGGLLQASSLGVGSNPGAVGDIFINSDVIAMSAGSIEARSFGAALPGKIVINGRLLTLDNGAVVSATSRGAGNAGDIRIGVADTLTMNNASQITTTADNGSGGDITLFVNKDLLMHDSEISTSVRGPTANGGNITIDPRFVILDNSQIVARAIGGSGGNINLTTQYLVKSASSSIDASSQLGINGHVEIVAVNADLNADIAELPTDFLSAKKWLAQSCANRQGNDISQFTVRSRDGAYRSTADLLMSPMLMSSAAVSPMAISSATHTKALDVAKTFDVAAKDNLFAAPLMQPLISFRPDCLHGPG